MTLKKTEKTKKVNINNLKKSMGVIFGLEPNVVFAAHALETPTEKYGNFYAKVFWQDNNLYRELNATIDKVVNDFKALLLRDKSLFNGNPNKLDTMAVNKPYVHQPDPDKEDDFVRFEGWYTMTLNSKNRPALFNNKDDGDNKAGDPLNLTDDPKKLWQRFIGGASITIYPYIVGGNIGVTASIEAVGYDSPAGKREDDKPRHALKFKKCTLSLDDDEDIPF